MKSRTVGPLVPWLFGALLFGCGGGATATPLVPAGSASSSASAAAPPTPPPTTTAPSPSPAFNDLAGAGALVISALEGPDFVIVEGGLLYAGDVHGGMEAYDATGKRLAYVAVPGGPCAGLDVGFGAVWSATCEPAPGLVRFDTKTFKLIPVPIGGGLPDSEASIGVGEGGVWLIRQTARRELVVVDPKSMKVARTVAAPDGATAVRVGLGAVWISSPTLDTITRVDPATMKVVATVKVGRQPQFFAIGEGAVWTMDQVGGSVSRIDPAANAVAATIPLGETIEGGDIAVGGGFVWVHGYKTLLFQIDPSTNAIVARYGPPQGSGGVAADDDAVWITAHDYAKLWRLPIR